MTGMQANLSYPHHAPAISPLAPQQSPTFHRANSTGRGGGA